MRTPALLLLLSPLLSCAARQQQQCSLASSPLSAPAGPLRLVTTMAGPPKNVEIERKFLVRGDGWRDEAESSEHMRQGFLSVDPERTVRVRVLAGKGYLTIKGKSKVRADLCAPACAGMITIAHSREAPSCAYFES